MFSHVQQGQDFLPKAGDWNAMIDAARAYRGKGPDILSSSQNNAPQNTIALIKNNTAAAVSRGQVLGLGVPLLTPDNNLPEFKTRLTFNGEAPTFEDHCGKYAVMLTSVSVGEIGRGCVAGVCPVQLYVTDELNADYADVDTALGSQGLMASASGSAAVLWREGLAASPSPSPSPGSWQWAIIRIGTTAGIRVKNIGAEDAPAHSVLWITDIDENGILQAQKPEHPYLKPLVITSQAIAKDVVGYAHRSGIHLVRCEDWGSSSLPSGSPSPSPSASPSPTLTEDMFPFQAICQVDSFNIRRHLGDGNFLVWKKSTTEPLVFAELIQ